MSGDRAADRIKGRRVLIHQRRLTHYRVPLFERLRTLLADDDIALDLVHGQPDPSEVGKKDSGHLPWAVAVQNRYWRVSEKYVCWQPTPVLAAAPDLVIVTQENSLLSNYPLLLKRRFGGPRLAYWGHGANLQSGNPHGLKERFKRWTTNQVDWWFAYTGLSVDLVKRSGFPSERITNLENAIDTAGLRADLGRVTPAGLAALRDELGWGDECAGHVGLFLGSLHADKRLDFLIQAADRLHAMDPLFRLLIVGDGPLRDWLAPECAARPWCAWVGAKSGEEKARHLALADVLLNPGLVGLGILDAFVAGAPMLTTDCGLHSPEIAYLRDGENGLMTADEVESFAAAATRLLTDTDRRAKLAASCREAARHYTVENMAANFHAGILRALRT